MANVKGKPGNPPEVTGPRLPPLPRDGHAPYVAGVTGRRNGAFIAHTSIAFTRRANTSTSWRRPAGRRRRHPGRPPLMVAVGLLVALGLTTSAGAAVASTAKRPPPRRSSRTPSRPASTACATLRVLHLVQGHQSDLLPHDRALRQRRRRARRRVRGRQRQPVLRQLPLRPTTCTARSAPAPIADYGILLCSNSNGAGTYQGYIDRSGDISWILLNWGRWKHHNRRHHAVRLQHQRGDRRSTRTSPTT